MLLENVSRYLLDFTSRIETKGLLSAESAAQIRKHIRTEESPVRWELFLIIGALFGAIGISAGIYAITSHNWYYLPIWLRNVFGVVPVGVALYFYYRMLRDHRNSRAWVEATSLFLMLMIGSSIAITTQTYHMAGDFSGFLKVLLVFTIPLFYIANASGVALFYLNISLGLLYSDVTIDVTGGEGLLFGSNSVWFWCFFLALLPHYYKSISVKNRQQGVRFMFLSLIMYVTLYSAIMTSVDSNRILWSLVYNVGVYLFANRFMGNHFWFLHRFLSWIPQIIIAVTLLVLSNQTFQSLTFSYDSIYKMGDWDGGEWYWFTLLMVVVAGIYFNYFLYKEKFQDVNQLIIFSPVFLFLLMTIDYFTDSWWLISLPMNLYIFLIGVVVLVNGSEEGRFIKMLGGLILIAALFVTRYFDMSMSYIFKGLLFMLFGAVFFTINMFVKEKVDQINRQKKR